MTPQTAARRSIYRKSLIGRAETPESRCYLCFFSDLWWILSLIDLCLVLSNLLHSYLFFFLFSHTCSSLLWSLPVGEATTFSEEAPHELKVAFGFPWLAHQRSGLLKGIQTHSTVWNVLIKVVGVNDESKLEPTAALPARWGCLKAYTMLIMSVLITALFNMLACYLLLISTKHNLQPRNVISSGRDWRPKCWKC